MFPFQSVWNDKKCHEGHFLLKKKKEKVQKVSVLDQVRHSQLSIGMHIDTGIGYQD